MPPTRFTQRIQNVVDKAQKAVAAASRNKTARNRVASDLVRHQVQLNSMAGDAANDRDIEALGRAYVKLQRMYDRVHDRVYERARRSMTRRPSFF